MFTRKLFSKPLKQFWRHCCWPWLRLLGQTTMPNFSKLWQLIEQAIMNKPFAYCSRWHNKVMLWRNTIWA